MYWVHEQKRMSFTFNCNELRLARIFNELTLEELAEKVNKTRQYLHKLETGQTEPTKELLEKLAENLKVNPSFFTKSDVIPIREEQCHFRKLLTTRLQTKQLTISRIEFVRRLVKYLDQILNLPQVNIPEKAPLSLDDIEKAAEFCRKEWGLGYGPISNINRLAESKGIIIANFQQTKEIDALSVVGQRPIIIRNEFKESACRQRFDIAHEIGHFVLHSGTTTGDRTTESQANHFASAFLIPRTMMAKLFPRLRGSQFDWKAISEFKLTWKVSKAAILYRAHQLNLIDNIQYKTGIIALKRGGEAIKEKEDDLIPQESPELLSLAFSVLASQGIYAEDIASKLYITPDLLEKIVDSKLLRRKDKYTVTKNTLRLVK